MLNETTNAPINHAIVGASAAPRVSEMERFYTALSCQGELLDRLEDRLRMVSDAATQKGGEVARDTMPHISSFVDMVARNNGRLEQIIASICL